MTPPVPPTPEQLGFDTRFFVLLVAGIIGTVLHATKVLGFRAMFTEKSFPPTFVGGTLGVLYPKILSVIPFFGTVYAWDTAELAIFVLTLSFCTSFFLLESVTKIVTRLVQKKTSELTGEPDPLQKP